MSMIDYDARPVSPVPVLVGTADAQAPVTVVKIGTIVPEGSPWHDVLLELAERWRTLSHGGVQVKIYAGGTQGDEAELVRKVRIGLLQGVSITSNGLGTAAILFF